MKKKMLKKEKEMLEQLEAVERNKKKN